MDWAPALVTSVNALSAPLVGQINDVVGTQPQTMVVEHQGVKVGYTYQVWMIKEASVCEDRRSNLLEYSRWLPGGEIVVRGSLQLSSGTPAGPLEARQAQDHVLQRGQILQAAGRHDQRIRGITADFRRSFESQKGMLASDRGGFGEFGSGGGHPAGCRMSRVQ